jgi:DNA-binding NarL/FixJ family response regulator
LVSSPSSDDRSAKIHAMIVEDEPLARSNLKVLLRNDPEIALVGECGSGAEALVAIREKTPDLLFLDVQMLGMRRIRCPGNAGQRLASGSRFRYRL